VSNAAFLVGRIIFGLFWVSAGFSHFKKLDHMAEYAKAKKVPAPKLAVAASGVMLLIGGLSMLLGVCPRIGIVVLVLFLLGASFLFHNYWNVDDPQIKQVDQINFMKNVALVGALLMLLSLPQPWPWSLWPR
jgi:uncharacterized membrane protein YphA (DoxX/SURF4 family)